MTLKESALIAERVITLQPSLAKLIGLSSAVALQQLKFALAMPRSGRRIDGHKWVWNTYEDWQRDFFSFWSTRTIRRAFQDLEKRGLVVSCQPDGHASRKKYYRLNQGMEMKLTIQAARMIRDGELDASRCGQIVHMDAAKLDASLTETSQSKPKRRLVTKGFSSSGLITGYIPSSPVTAQSRT